MAFVVREAVAAGLGVEAASLLEVKGALAAGCRGGKKNFIAPPINASGIPIDHRHTHHSTHVDDLAQSIKLQTASSSTRPPRRTASWSLLSVRSFGVIYTHKYIYINIYIPLPQIYTHTAHGIHVNANTLEELDRVASILARLQPSHGPVPSIGLRINPLVGAGRIAELSVSTLASKFGVNLVGGHREEVMDRFRRYPWLCGLHIHVGSQVHACVRTLKGSFPRSRREGSTHKQTTRS